jgi:hypothetical protein
MAELSPAELEIGGGWLQLSSAELEINREWL